MWSRTSDPGPSMWNWFWGAESTAHKMRWIKGAHSPSSSGSCERPEALWGEMTIFWRGHLEQSPHFSRVFFSLEFWFVSHFPLVKDSLENKERKISSQFKVIQRNPICCFFIFIFFLPDSKRFHFYCFLLFEWKMPHGSDKQVQLVKTMSYCLPSSKGSRMNSELEHEVTLGYVETAGKWHLIASINSIKMCLCCTQGQQL